MNSVEQDVVSLYESISRYTLQPNNDNLNALLKSARELSVCAITFFGRATDLNKALSTQMHGSNSALDAMRSQNTDLRTKLAKANEALDAIQNPTPTASTEVDDVPF